MFGNIGASMSKTMKTLEKQNKNQLQMEQILKKAMANNDLPGNVAKEMAKLIKAQNAFMNSAIKDLSEGEKATKAAEGAMRGSNMVSVDIKLLKELEKNVSAQAETLKKIIAQAK